VLEPAQEVAPDAAAAGVLVAPEERPAAPPEAAAQAWARAEARAVWADAAAGWDSASGPEWAWASAPELVRVLVRESAQEWALAWGSDSGSAHAEEGPGAVSGPASAVQAPPARARARASGPQTKQ
jgi:hypothetical protein